MEMETSQQDEANLVVASVVEQVSESGAASSESSSTTSGDIDKEGDAGSAAGDITQGVPAAAALCVEAWNQQPPAVQSGIASVTDPTMTLNVGPSKIDVIVVKKEEQEQANGDIEITKIEQPQENHSASEFVNTAAGGLRDVPASAISGAEKVMISAEEATAKAEDAQEEEAAAAEVVEAEPKLSAESVKQMKVDSEHQLIAAEESSNDAKSTTTSASNPAVAASVVAGEGDGGAVTAVAPAVASSVAAVPGPFAPSAPPAPSAPSATPSAPPPMSSVILI